MLMRAWWLLALCAWHVQEVKGHGRMLIPPSRPSAWRLGYPAPINYNDNQQNCGGRDVEKSNDYKCGICGDPWEPFPHPYERPNGDKIIKENYILSNYRKGGTIDVSIQITASHKGYFEFFLCNMDASKKPDATLECLHKHQLTAQDRPTGNNTRVYDVATGKHIITLQLPKGLTCHHCVLQWKWTCGNDWHNGGLGRGHQEEFYSCADLSITPKSEPSVSSTTDLSSFVPENLRPSPDDPNPLSKELINYFLCNFCSTQDFLHGVLPNVCIFNGYKELRACGKNLR